MATTNVNRATSPRRCLDCGEPTDATYGLCRGCMLAGLDRECAEQGVPVKVTDPLVLDRARTFLTAAETRKAAS